MEDGPPIFRQDFTCPVLLIAHLVLQAAFDIQDYHLLWSVFPGRSTKLLAKERWLVPFRSPLLRESRLISFPPDTEMFQFPGLASTPYVFRCKYLPYGKWVSPFGHPRIKACLPAHRGLSQATTSFIASYRLGIHRMRLVT